MFYKHNTFTGKLATSEAQATYQPQGFSTAKPTGSAQAMDPVSTGKGGTLDSLSRIVKSQKLFQATQSPIYVGKGPKDVMLYRGAMALTLLGLSFTFFSVGQMALGMMKKK
ncbi:cytochrome c oxidase subunit 7A-related protein, mitochondrial [Exaiptasia diaphana]|uniref:Uncharacterized protein n=1 Tax=Exaiptasia diaphana TaxID=2652724 RepID=A0A913XPQ6_EXADI|nr:cytochrome c oxidase subunit 7A-related protein, mitochondrial [Exaiptasia diaphana]KXJ10227.1 Cytochrome c oxidase subunit 7A-related protein, mitochondrial [Exaiptasia diaphana]